MIPQSKPFIEKEDFSYIEKILETGQVAAGPLVEELEHQFSCLLGNLYSFAVSSGTSALYLVLLALGVGEGDEVVIPSYTCTSVLNAVNYLRAVPVLADIDPETFNLNVGIVRKLVNRKTRAIIVTHTFGFPADTKEIAGLGIPVVEDCAHALGATYHGRPAGVDGSASIFSLYATKMVCSGEGGIISTNNPEIAGFVNDMIKADMRENYRIRYNYKMSDLTAGLAVSQLKKLYSFIGRRRAIAKQYIESFSTFRSLEFQKSLPETETNYYRFAVLSGKAERLIKYSQQHGVMCDRPVFRPLHHYHNAGDGRSFAATDLVWNKAVSVPIYPALSNQEVQAVIKTFVEGIKINGS